ncbi:MAG TPA: aminoacyl-tRNA hydrolase [Firmicutes bacterium]|nr:aminoacyl-tRNA hydrolase [Bacillota bacterium]
MKLIVGLGNPGKEYELTRHNCGFRVLDEFKDIVNVDFDYKDFGGEYAKFKLDDEYVFLFKPLTYMNLSGTAVQKIAHYFKISTDDILVIYDDMAIKPGELRLRTNGSSGGQKGMQNIIDNLNTDQIKRIRVGIGEPPNKGAVDYVLGKPFGDDKTKIDDAISRAALAIREYLNHDFSKAMCKYNGGGNN